MISSGEVGRRLSERCAASRAFSLWTRQARRERWRLLRRSNTIKASTAAASATPATIHPHGVEDELDVAASAAVVLVGGAVVDDTLVDVVVTGAVVVVTGAVVVVTGAVVVVTGAVVVVTRLVVVVTGAVVVVTGAVVVVTRLVVVVTEADVVVTVELVGRATLEEVGGCTVIDGRDEPAPLPPLPHPAMPATKATNSAQAATVRRSFRTLI